MGGCLGNRYVSVSSIDKKVLQEQSCLELLCYLTVSAPACVMACVCLDPSCFIGGQQEVEDFRKTAVELRNLIGFDQWSLAWQMHCRQNKPMFNCKVHGNITEELRLAAQSSPAIGGSTRCVWPGPPSTSPPPPLPPPPRAPQFPSPWPRFVFSV